MLNKFLSNNKGAVTHSSSGTIFVKGKKGISPVVATALLLVVSVVAVVGFQNWFSMYSSETLTSIEIKSNSNGMFEIKDVIGGSLYVLNNKDLNKISQVKINGQVCNENFVLPENKLYKIDVSDCNFNQGEAEIVIATQDLVVTKKSILKSGSNSCINNTAQGFYGGIGTQANPWQICSCSQLQNMENYLGGNFSLISNINCAGFDYGDGNGFMPVGRNLSDRFSGSFEGNYNSIGGLYINRPDGFLGLFGSFNGDFIQNLDIYDAYINGQNFYNVGLLVGSSGGYFIDNVSVSGLIIDGGDNVGGLVGQTDSGSLIIQNSNSNVEIINGGYMTGGLAGYVQWSNILKSYSTGNVNGNDEVGGLVGNCWVCNINDSFSYSNVNGNNYVGGLVGFTTSDFNPANVIENSYSTGLVNGVSNVGGLVGDNDGSSLSTITSSYYNNETSGQTDTGKGEPRTTTQLRTQANFIGWDFANIWQINEGVSYPSLR